MAIPKKKDPAPRINRAIAKWRAFFIPFKKSERATAKLKERVDRQKSVVIGELQAAGLETFESPLGVVSLQRQTSVDWHMVLHDVITQLGEKGVDVRAMVDVDATEKAHTKQGEVFVRAPQSWAGKAG
jgi:hypothetical protein